jgi:hypothetical protein
MSLLPAIAILALPSIGAAQYRNSATGQTFNNSYSAMMSVTNSMMQNFTTQQRQYLSNTAKMASAYPSPSSPPSPSQPVQPQPMPTQNAYPITATDFQGSMRREVPPRLIEGMTGVQPQERIVLRNLYYQLLADYEKTNRRSNVAAAIAYTIRVSLEIDRGRKLSMPESDNMILSLNNTLASVPQFNAMTPQQKQMLYESCVLTGGMAAVMYVEGQQRRDVSLQVQARQLAQSVLSQWAGM